MPKQTKPRKVHWGEVTCRAERKHGKKCGRMVQYTDRDVFVCPKHASKKTRHRLRKSKALRARLAETDDETGEPRWKSLTDQGYERYLVSRDGAVCTVSTPESVRYGHSSIENGALKLHFENKHAKRVIVTVHDLVARAYLPNPGKRPWVVHVDNVKKNNHVRNLRWATAAETSAMRPAPPHASRAVPLQQLDPITREVVREWDNIEDAYKFCHASRVTFSRRLKKEQPFAYNGFLWQECPVDNLCGEVWKTIPYPEYAEMHVSNKGRLRDGATKRLVNGSSHKSGYRIVRLHPKKRGQGKKKGIFVHRLVLFTFRGRMDHMQINHIDGIKTNNVLENLEFCDPSQNSDHAHATGLNKTSRPVIQYDLELKELARHRSALVASKVTGVARSGIWNVCRGKAFSAAGYRWRYADEVEAQ